MLDSNSKDNRDNKQRVIEEIKRFKKRTDTLFSLTQPQSSSWVHGKM